MTTTLPARYQVVTEIAPSNDPWQASWYNWHETVDAEGHSGSRRPPHQQSPRDSHRSDVSQGCSNFRTLLCSESLGEFWEAMLGQVSAQEYVIESWTQLLHLN